MLTQQRWMHRSVRAVAIPFALVACNDSGPTAPTVPVPVTASELSGTWTISDSLVITTPVEESVCRNRGVVTFTAGLTSTFADVRLVGTCHSPRGPGSLQAALESPDVSIMGDSISFTASGRIRFRETCTYRGRLTGGRSLDAEGVVSCAGGASGTWRMSWGLTEAPSLQRLVMVDIGLGQSCALDENGQAWCWGGNPNGQLGTGDDRPHLVPAPVAGGLRFSQISVANEGAFMCAVTTTGEAWCWGYSGGGRLGDGSGAEEPRSVTSPQPVVGGHTFKQIASAGTHTCALTTAGAAYCWGYNSLGELGTGNRTPSSVPVPVSGGLTFTQIDTYTGVSCGVTTSGAAYCWGEGWAGALGNGTTDDSDVPVAVQGGLTFASVSVGLWMACGVTTDGDGYCWGSDWGSGNLGTGAYADTETRPVLVTGGKKWKSIRAGGFVACGVTTANGGYCWGDNFNGTLGAGASMKGGSNKPIAIAGSLVFDHAVIDWHGCALTLSGTAYCWSDGSNGQIGDGNLRLRLEPVKVAGQR